MESRQHLLYGAIVLAVFVSVAESIKCYQCTSVTDPRCTDVDPTNTSLEFYRDCSGDYEGFEPFCRKTVQTIIDHHIEIRVHRSCGWKPDHHPKPCYRFENDFHYEILCACHTDGCNTSSSTIPWNLGALLLIVCVLKFLRW